MGVDGDASGGFRSVVVRAGYRSIVSIRYVFIQARYKYGYQMGNYDAFHVETEAVSMKTKYKCTYFMTQIIFCRHETRFKETNEDMETFLNVPEM